MHIKSLPTGSIRPNQTATQGHSDDSASTYFDSILGKLEFDTDQNVKKSIEKIGVILLKPANREFGNNNSQLLATYLVSVIEQIEVAEGAKEVTSLFGGNGTTNMEENLYLLRTAIETRNDALSQTLSKVINEKIKEVAANKPDSYFHNAEQKEQNLVLKARDRYKHSLKQAAGLKYNPELYHNNGTPNITSSTATAKTTSDITCYGVKYKIIPTSGDQNNCLIYALYQNKIENPDRDSILDLKSIKDQLNKIYQIIHSDFATDEENFDNLKVHISAIYNNIKLDENVHQIDNLAEVLHLHITTSNCFLDSQIVAPILASRLNETVVILKANAKNSSGYDFKIIGSDGSILHNGDLGEEAFKDLESKSPVFIHNYNGYHFSSMVKTNVVHDEELDLESSCDESSSVSSGEESSSVSSGDGSSAGGGSGVSEPSKSKWGILTWWRSLFGRK